MQIGVIVAAGGRGRRMNSSVSKQFLKIKGHPILYYTLKVFESLNFIDEIILVIGSHDRKLAEKYISYYRLKKVKVVEGGKERQNSVYNGLSKLSPQTDVVIIHDGVRPFVTKEMIESSIKGAKKYGAVGVAVPVKDTIKVIDRNKFIKDTPKRSALRAIQTPQVFKYDLIMKAYKKAFQDGFYGTDDTVLVERLGHPVKLIDGSYENIKITTPEDILIAETFVRLGYGDFWR